MPMYPLNGYKTEMSSENPNLLNKKATIAVIVIIKFFLLLNAWLFLALKSTIAIKCESAEPNIPVKRSIP